MKIIYHNLQTEKRNLLAQSSLSSKQLNTCPDSVPSSKSDQVEVQKVCTPLGKKQDKASLSSNGYSPNSMSTNSGLTNQSQKNINSKNNVGSTTKSSNGSTNHFPSQSSITV